MPATSVPKKRRQSISQEERDQIVLSHLPLARAIAIRVRESLPVYVDLDDLTHAGVLGLFDAVEKYDSEKNVAFHAYAKHRIKGAILDSLRELDWASRDLRKQQKQADSVSRALSSKLGRTPEESEIASEMGLSPDRWHRIQLELHTVSAVCSPTKPNQDNNREMEFPATPELRPDRMCGHRQLQDTLARAMETLPSRYQKVVFLYYTNGLTMKEIGESMGVNESRVSQIHKVALQMMGTALQSDGVHSAEAF
jgi:RNA polymerase sigma factor FliA